MSVEKHKYTSGGDGALFDMCVFVLSPRNVWFRASDVMRILKYTKSSTNVLRRVPPKHLRRWCDFTNESSALIANYCDLRSTTLFLTETLMHRLIMRSNQPDAKHFGNWVKARYNNRLTGQLNNPTYRPTIPHEQALKTIATTNAPPKNAATIDLYDFAQDGCRQIRIVSRASITERRDHIMSLCGVAPQKTNWREGQKFFSFKSPDFQFSWSACRDNFPHATYGLRLVNRKNLLFEILSENEVHRRFCDDTRASKWSPSDTRRFRALQLRDVRDAIQRCYIPPEKVRERFVEIITGVYQTAPRK